MNIDDLRVPPNSDYHPGWQQCQNCWQWVGPGNLVHSCTNSKGIFTFEWYLPPKPRAYAWNPDTHEWTPYVAP